MDNNNEIISKLKFISRIDKGEKINVQGLFLQEESYLTSISRTILRPESRTKTLSFLQNVINKSIEIIVSYLTSHDYSQHLIATNLLKDLEESKKGLDNLKTTYSEDVMFCCNMDSLIEMIDIKISDINTNYNTIVENGSVEINE
tara:strand:+ start:5205 stop:5639 length:435 start_codon:yes stop_codon:yes gene_type:complete